MSDDPSPSTPSEQPQPDPMATVPRDARPVDPVMAKLTAATAGEYRIERELGRGGMATVYLAHDLALDRKVAIKVMSPELFAAGDELINRFLREARTGARLNHPHIIPVYAIRESTDLIFFVMKFIDGKPLDDIIKSVGPLPIPLVARVVAQVADALAYAHRSGVVHRDIKPGNLLLDKEGWVVLTDLGIAKVQESSMLTATGAAIGTPTYMSPEQISGSKEVAGAADQYSLGCVAFEMLTGQPPFVAETYVALIFQHIAEPPPPLQQHRPDCPGEIVAAVARMLEKAPEDRFVSLEEVSKIFRNAATGDEEEFRLLLRAFATGSGAAEAVNRINNTPRSTSPRPVSATPRPSTRPSKRQLAVSSSGMQAVPRDSTMIGTSIANASAVPAAGPVTTQTPWPRTLLKPKEQVMSRRRFRAPGLLTLMLVGGLSWFFAFPRFGDIAATVPATTALMGARLEEAEAAVRRGTAPGTEGSCDGIRNELSSCRKHLVVAMSAIAPVMAEAVILGIDPKFAERQGSDWTAMRRAAGYPRDAFEWGNSVDRSDLLAVMPGLLKQMGTVGRAGSLTQYLVQVIWFPPNDGLFRKAREVAVTRRLAGALPKERIMELYLNVAEFGPGLYGVEAASQAYFGVAAKDLNKVQAATLAATLATPRTSTPTLEPARMRKRQALILRRLNGEVISIPSVIGAADSASSAP